MELKLTPQEEQEILETFIAESSDKHEQLDTFLTALEAEPSSKSILHDLNRVLHTLKGNAMSMGFSAIGELCHLMEEIFSYYKKGVLELNKDVFDALFKSSDKLGELIRGINEDKRITHKGIKTRLEVLIRDAKGEELVVEHTEPTDIQITPEVIAQDCEYVPTDEELVSQENEESQEPQEPIVQQLPEEPKKEKASFFVDLVRRLSRYIKELFRLKKDHTIEEERGHSFLSKKEERPSLTVDNEASFYALFEENSDENAPPEQSVEEAISDPENVLNEEEVVVENDTESTDLLDKLYDKVEVSDTVQVPIRKLDALMNQMGQLIIERDRLASKEDSRAHKAELASLHRITSDLQYSVMNVRLVQVGTLFNKFHRVVRDVAEVEKKMVTLQIKGSDVEIDRTVLKTISDSLIHLVRNAIGHGLETADVRKELNKPVTGVVTLNAYSDKDHVIIEVTDDGAGVDPEAIREKLISKGIVSSQQAKSMSDDELIMHIFHTGFSSANQVSEISGRGVGMDVVKKSVETIGGQVNVQTKVGFGTTIRLKLPASLVVKGVLMFTMQSQEYALPLAYTASVISLTKKDIRKAGLGLMATFLNKPISIVFLSDLLRMDDFSEIYDHGNLHRSFDEKSNSEKFEVVVVSNSGREFGVVVDKLLQQKEVIEKPLPYPLEGNVLLSGTTILGTGNICMILDAVAITEMLYSTKFKVYESQKAS